LFFLKQSLQKTGLLVLGTNGTVHSVPQSEQVTVVDSSLLSFLEPLSYSCRFISTIIS
jgi:hypothetical protein